MSCLIPNFAHKKLDLLLNHNYRSFVNVVRYENKKKIDYSLLFMVYNSPCVDLPNRIENYRNHFKLFTNGKNEIFIVRSETTLAVYDSNIIVEYEMLTLKEAMHNSIFNWDISFDTITYCKKKPSNLKISEFRLLYFGEWWFFDKGIILLGYKKQEYRLCSTMIYYELIPDNAQSKSTNYNLTIPSVNWFSVQNEELKKKNINYFIPFSI